MGTMVYGYAGVEMQLSDRDMAHIQLAVGAKLQRRESFFFSWRHDPRVSEGRGSIWLNESVPLYFNYESNVAPAINRGWIGLLTEAASSPEGMRYVKEPHPAQEERPNAVRYLNPEPPANANQQ